MPWPEPSTATTAAPCPARHPRHGGDGMAKNGKRLGFLPGWRKGTYIILLFNILMLVWVIAGASTASGNAKDCGVLDQATCNSARDAGTAIGVGLLIGLWVAGD